MRELFWGLFDIWNGIQQMTLHISVVILLVLLCRLAVGKVSKQASYFLWAIVAIRLIVPVMPESEFSIFNAINHEIFLSQTITSEETVLPGTPTQENTGGQIHNQSENISFAPDMNQETVILDGTIQEKPSNVNDNTNTAMDTDIIYSDITSEPNNVLKTNWQFLVWLTGVAVLATYGVISYCTLQYKLRFATSNDQKVYEDEHISSPFVFGIIKPRIYLPYRLSIEERDYILLHENYHIRRRDYIVKMFAFGLLAVYWFHPLVWVAYYMMSRDMELSCDEQVLKELGVEERKAYSTLLLSFACEKRIPLPSPVSFGENDIKSRIKGILNYKKPTFWSLVGMLVLIAALVMGCLTDAKDETHETSEESVEALAETLFELKSQYIGDAVTNGKILNVLFEAVGVDGFNGMELQTITEPYWISINLDEEPDNNRMWQASAMFLALVENANEVRWNYYDEDDDLCTYYVTTESVNNWMEGTNIKDYASSEEKLAQLWQMLDEKRIYATYSKGSDRSFLVSFTAWDNRAMEVGMDFTERIEWENRMIADSIGYRGDEGHVRHCYYQDFDQNGTKDLIVIIRDLNWDDNVDDIFCIYMNDEPVYVHEVPYMGAFWNVTVADVDNDTNLEFLFSGDSGGTGGYGFNAIFELLKYKNGTFEAMPLPLDEYCEWEEETAGFGIELYTTDTAGQYRAYCPGIDEEVLFKVHTYNDTDFEPTTPANSLVGKECYGFHALTPVLQDGKYYLLAKEAVERSDGPYRFNDIAIAEFLLYWDETNGWVADSFDVIPHGVDGISADKFDLAERLLSYKTDASFSNDTGTGLAVISELAAHYDIHNFESVNSQMAAQPGWITLTFSEQPDDTAMWKMASVFLALYEDIEEFRWEFVGANDTLYTYYVTRDDVAKILKRDDVTEYAVSDDHLSGMMMLLDENATGVTKSTNDMEQKINKHLSYSIFHHYTDKAGVPRDVADYYERRLMEDDVVYRNDENKAIYECIYKDFDHSGEMDMVLYIRDLGYGESTLHIYMNDDPLYAHVMPMSCWSMEILSGDIDHDGHTELVYSAHNGGTGGAGGYVKGILKYRNHTFTEMSLPGEFLEEETSQGDNGYNIDVYWGNEENSYIITCESLGIREQIYSEYLKDEDGSYVIPSKQGQLVGANCRGFYTLYVINENGKDYLMAEEYFHGEAGVNHSLGYMRFIFDWEKSDGWIVKECEIVPYNPILTDERGYFVGMKKDIKYYPSDYETIIKNWTIPVIDHNGEIMFERNNRFSVFAQDASNNASSFDFVFARLNEKDEITYVYICYEDEVYYYLEDYTRLSEKPGNADSEGYSTAIYTNEVYDATMYSSGECYEHFYLTNEENLTHDDIMKAMLSSQYPPQIDVTTVYSKKLDEKGLNSYMNATGDFITYGIDINLPKNRSWISSPNYKDMGNSLIRANYYDMILSADMVLRAGPRKIVFEKARAGLEDDLSEWDYETWSAWTADDEYVEIKLYVEQLGGTNFNTVVAEWEYEGNTYLLYGDTQETDGSPVAKTAAFIIEQFKK